MNVSTGRAVFWLDDNDEVHLCVPYRGFIPWDYVDFEVKHYFVADLQLLPLA